MAVSDQKTVERRLTYSALSAAFMSVFALFHLLTRRKREVRLTPMDLAMMGFATYRLGRLVAYDKVMEAFRSMFAQTVPDPSGAGESVEPRRGSGVQEAIGELLCCPICVGTWVAAGLVYALQLAPRPARVFLSITSAIGIAELLNAATEAFSWFGQAARDEAGLIETGAMPVAPVPKPKRPTRRRTSAKKKAEGE